MRSAVATVQEHFASGRAPTADVIDAARACEVRLLEAPAARAAQRIGQAVTLSPYMRALLQVSEECARG
ncbi:MAG TPA: hypothetical protein VGP72_14600 [Planctomycetota bacterium]|jgi:hypothetical protein